MSSILQTDTYYRCPVLYDNIIGNTDIAVIKYSKKDEKIIHYSHPTEVCVLNSGPSLCDGGSIFKGKARTKY